MALLCSANGEMDGGARAPRNVEETLLGVEVAEGGVAKNEGGGGKGVAEERERKEGRSGSRPRGEKGALTPLTPFEFDPGEDGCIGRLISVVESGEEEG